MKRPKPGTQAGRVLALLEERRGAKVGVLEIQKRSHSMAPHTVISTLRTRYGYVIENSMELVDGRMMSCYWLINTHPPPAKQEGAGIEGVNHTAPPREKIPSQSELLIVVDPPSSNEQPLWPD